MIRFLSSVELLTIVLVFSVNKVVPKAQVLATALEWANQINLNSPDSIQSTKRALLLNKQKSGVEEVVAHHMRSKESRRAFAGENMKVCLHFPVTNLRPH